MPKINAFSISILRPHYNGEPSDCTNGGVSSKHDRFVAVLSEADGMVALEEQSRYQTGNPILVLEQHVPGAVRLRPLRAFVPGWVMFGGNYARGDSRFGEAVAALLGTQVRMYDPVAIHDRVEG